MLSHSQLLPIPIIQNLTSNIHHSQCRFARPASLARLFCKLAYDLNRFPPFGSIAPE
jgi:hypothetical protein